MVAREIEVSLPCELPDEVNFRLAGHFADWLAAKYQIVCDFSVHAGRAETATQAGNGNIHVHILMSACHIHRDGSLGKKCMLLDPIFSRKSGYVTSVFVDRLVWQSICNMYLESEGICQAVDARSFEEQGNFDTQPSTHVGPKSATAPAHGQAKVQEHLAYERKSRRKRRKIATGWSLDKEALTQLVNTHLDLAHLEAFNSMRNDGFDLLPKENLRFSVDWPDSDQLSDGMYERPQA